MCCDGRPACRAFFLLISVVFIIGGAVAVVFFGINVAKPFIQTLSYKQTDCTVKRVSDSGYRRCDCGTECQSVLPCRVVLVQILNDHNTTNDVILYSNEDAWVRNRDKKCSSYFCHRDPDKNSDDVDTYMTKYGQPSQSYGCYYNGKGEAILNKHGWLDFGLFMGIPSACLFIGIIIMIVSCKNC